jgi:hypothetical protein
MKLRDSFMRKELGDGRSQTVLQAVHPMGFACGGCVRRAQLVFKLGNGAAGFVQSAVRAIMIDSTANTARASFLFPRSVQAKKRKRAASGDGAGLEQRQPRGREALRFPSTALLVILQRHRFELSFVALVLHVSQSYLDRSELVVGLRRGEFHGARRPAHLIISWERRSGMCLRRERRSWSPVEHTTRATRGRGP